MKRALLIVRPEPGNAASLERCRALGISALGVPLFEARSLHWSVPDAAEFDAIMFTSASAVRMAGRQLEGLRGLGALCVGQATADEARKAGFSVLDTGTGGVASLLAPHEGQVLHLCGVDRSDYGTPPARITPVPVYESVELAEPAALTDALAQRPVIALHSPRAARRIAQLVPDKQHFALAAISTAAAEAGGQGWKKVAIAAKPSDGELLVTAHQLIEEMDHR